MSKEWIDVVDTAVKIGLGALITGTFTYIGVKFSHHSEKNKFMLEHKTKVIEQVANDIEIYFSAVNRYTSRVAGITRQKFESGTDGSDFGENQIKSISDRDSALVDSWNNRESAISKLRLLKATEVAKELSKFKYIEKELRDQIVFDRKVPLREHVIEHRDKIRKYQKSIHNKLSDFYEQLQT